MSSTLVNRFRIPFVVRGTVIEGEAATPYALGSGDSSGLDLNSLVWPADRPAPLFATPIAEILEILDAVGSWLSEDPDGVVADALDGLTGISGASRPLAERAYDELPRYFGGDLLRFQLEQELGATDLMERWHKVWPPGGNRSFVRAFPVRMAHVLAGNAPGVAAITIARSAIVKGVSLLKLASNDLFTAPAILRGISAVAPGHALEQSFSAVYWRGGDEAVESVLLRSQFFDKLIVWGGAPAVHGVARYVGPGLDLVSFDPKTSISFIGERAFDDDVDLRSVAAAGATDATVHDQDACTASRFQFVQGSLEDVDRYCALLVQELGVERTKASARSHPVPADLRDEIDGLRTLDPYYRVWGSVDGSGMVIRSSEPVEFYPTGRVVNVVAVASEKEMFQHINASTQTVSLYPEGLRVDLRDELCSIGVQRVTRLGNAGETWVGLPHDGFYPLERMVRWGKDES